MNKQQLEQALLDTEAQHVFIQMARRSGKTELMFEYMKHFLFHNPRKRVLVITASSNHTRMMKERLHQEIPEFIMGGYTFLDQRVRLQNNSEVQFLSGSSHATSSSMCGAKVDLIIVDDADIVPFSDAIYNVRMEDPKRIKIVMFGTHPNQDSFMSVLSTSRPSSAVYLSYDYRDAMRDKIFTPLDIFAYQSSFQGHRFKEDFGPFDPLIQVDNEAFMGKLRSEWDLAEPEYVTGVDWARP